MGVECMLVFAHATGLSMYLLLRFLKFTRNKGRTLVLPPQQHLYLLGRNHKDEHDKKAHDEMGFEDFYDISKLRTMKGLHVMEMKEFLAKEGVRYTNIG